jgi:hypothetical protein
LFAATRIGELLKDSGSVPIPLQKWISSLPYCPQLDRRLLIPSDRFDGHSQLVLRLAPSRNNQRLGVNWADDYEFEARLIGLLGP